MTTFRQRQIQADIQLAWERDPIVLLQRKATPELHGQTVAVNCLKIKGTFWRRGWDSNPVHPLKTRNLLILHGRPCRWNRSNRRSRVQFRYRWSRDPYVAWVRLPHASAISVWFEGRCQENEAAKGGNKGKLIRLFTELVFGGASDNQIRLYS
jgi:hypothetical protein